LTRARLSSAARQVFLRRGFRDATVDEIAAEAGYTTGAVYSNFSGKAELLLAVIEEYVNRRARAIEDLVTPASGVEQPRRAGQEWMQQLDEDPTWFPLFIEFWSQAVGDPDLREPLATQMRVVRATVARLLGQAAERAHVQLPMSPEELAIVIKALANGIALEKKADPENVSDDLYGRFLVLLLQTLFIAAAPERSDPATRGTRRQLRRQIKERST
jgi:AcrR family transcriptional regulator